MLYVLNVLESKIPGEVLRKNRSFLCICYPSESFNSEGVLGGPIRAGAELPRSVPSQGSGREGRGCACACAAGGGLRRSGRWLTAHTVLGETGMRMRKEKGEMEGSTPFITSDTSTQNKAHILQQHGRHK